MGNEIFKVGFGRKDITPAMSATVDSDAYVRLNTGDALTEMRDPIYTTCVAMNDGEKTVLIFTIDVKIISRGHDMRVRRMINERTGIPIENMMLNCMHNHSVPSPGVPATDAIIKWTEDIFYPACTDAALEAIADLSNAEAYLGGAKATNFASVRRYIHEDGSFSSIHMRKRSKTPIVDTETQADDSVRFVRFKREGKKDVLIANWQAHAATAAATHPGVITADYVGAFRDRIEKDGEMLAAYYCGASGNINLSVKIPERNVCDGDVFKCGKMLGEALLAEIDNVKRIDCKKISARLDYFTVNHRKIDPERLKKAEEIIGYQLSDPEKFGQLMDENGFWSPFDVRSTISISKYPDTNDLPIGVIACGDIVFASVPYEMFDTNGIGVREASPYKTTFILTLTGDCLGYVPSALSVKNGGFECYMSIFEYGTAEKVEQKLKEMIGEIYIEK